MRATRIIVVLFLLVQFRAYPQDQFSDLFVIEKSKGVKKYLVFDPDSMKAYPDLQERCSFLWPAHQYLFSLYSKAYSESFKLQKLLPNIDAIRTQLNASLNADTAFQKIYMRSVNRSLIPPIHLDSLMPIAARFFYVHRMGKEAVQHICVGINEVLQMPQTEHTPYYNAFCYMAIYGHEEPFKFIREAVGDDVEELRKPISDERLSYFTEMVYTKLEKDPELRALLIKEYETKKEHLNFEMIY